MAKYQEKNVISGAFTLEPVGDDLHRVYFPVGEEGEEEALVSLLGLADSLRRQSS